jgi:hypothetical protein
MKIGFASLAVTLMLAHGAQAATPRPASVDGSGSFLIDEATSERLWKENTPARVAKLYPSAKYRFVSEVGGGFTDTKSCVVTARAMLLPVVMLPLQGRKMVYPPIKTATAFDAVPNLSREQCQALARTQLKSAIQAVMASLASS